MNMHATGVALGSTGVLIEGVSGSGKTSLALAAIQRFQSQNRFAALVADDQCLAEAAGGRLIASCPPVLAGLAEMRGLGIVQQHTLSSVVIDAVMRLVDQRDIERLPQRELSTIDGVKLPVFNLPRRQIVIALPILCKIIDDRLFKT
jgi:serine kinase of HPr protein (carbohydrate metabolism regulator)